MKVDLERLREAAKAGLACVSMAEMAALLAVVDAAREVSSCWPGGALHAALEPFDVDGSHNEREWQEAVKNAHPPAEAPTVHGEWEEVDRWNAERDLAVKAAVDATKGNPRDRDQFAGQQPKRERVQPGAFQAVLDRDPRDRARDQLADAGVAVQRQFRSDQERIAELEAELAETQEAAREAYAQLVRAMGRVGEEKP